MSPCPGACLPSPLALLPLLLTWVSPPLPPTSALCHPPTVTSHCLSTSCQRVLCEPRGHPEPCTWQELGLPPVKAAGAGHSQGSGSGQGCVEMVQKCQDKVGRHPLGRGLACSFCRLRDFGKDVCDLPITRPWGPFPEEGGGPDWRPLPWRSSGLDRTRHQEELPGASSTPALSCVREQAT